MVYIVIIWILTLHVLCVIYNNQHLCFTWSNC